MTERETDETDADARPERRVGFHDRGYVELAPGEGVDHALRRFKRQLDLARLTSELKRRQAAVPPSQARREKSRRARRREQKAAKRLAARQAGP